LKQSTTIRLFIAGLIFATACRGATATPTLVIRDVSVVDVRAGTTIPHRTVIVRDGHITVVGPSDETSIPGRLRSDQLIDGAGKYLIPGLWDMHVHLDSTDLPALVNHGITGARDMGGDLEQLLAWRSRIGADSMIGPRLVFAGPALSGEMTRERAAHIVDSLAARGVDFIKVHEGLPRAAYYAIDSATLDRQLTFVGHVPALLTPVEVANAGQHSIEHLEFVSDRCLAIFSGVGPRDCTARVDSVLDALARNDTWLCPTIGSFRIFATQQFPAIQTGFAALVPRIRARHIGLLAGTDLGSRGIIPGASLHDELALLVQAGFTPAEALLTATLGPAEFLGLSDSLGTVAPEKVADLVLLERDPLVDIRNTTSIALVVKGGSVVFRQSIQRAARPSAYHSSLFHW
jgi:cytosine/adenosine deaminase-related metal-dependent hydrolase